MIGKTKNSLLFFFVLSPLLWCVSCKKGEDDPYLSLKSRTNRIAGAWKLKEGRVQVEFSDKTNYVNQTYELSSSDYKHTVGGVGTFQKSHKLDVIFGSDGSFQFVENFDTLKFSTKGRWDFMQKGGEYKNKERIVVRLDKGQGSSYYFAFFNKSMTTFTYAVRELRKDRLVLEVVDDLVEIDDKGYKTHSNGFYVFER